MAKQIDKKDYDYDHGYMTLKDMQRWCGNQKFHDDVDKKLADIRKEREEKKKKNYDLGKGKNWCGKKPDSIKMEESQLREMVSKIIKESLGEMNNYEIWKSQQPHLASIGDLDISFDDNRHIIAINGWRVGDEKIAIQKMGQETYQRALQAAFGNGIQMNESKFRKMVSKIIKESLEELGGEDDFQPNGYKAMNNYGGNEIQVNKGGDSARIKFQDGEVTDWLEIEFDEEGVAYVTTPHGEQEKLSDYMRC